VFRLEVWAGVDGVDFGAGADDIVVSDGSPPSRDPLCDGEVGGVGLAFELSDPLAWPAVPVFDTVSWLEDWAPPDDDTVTPGATSTVDDEPLPASVATGVVVADDEASVGPGCAADGAVAAVLPSAPWLPAEGEPFVASGFAHAIPAGAAMADPTPNATASAPIRPTKLLHFIIPATPRSIHHSLPAVRSRCRPDPSTCRCLRLGR
jgi:hypothetical protein